MAAGRGGPGRLRVAAQASARARASFPTAWLPRGSAGGLAGLITWPVSEPVFAGELLGAARQRWNPHADDRVSALAAGYQFLLQAAASQARPAVAEARQ